MLNDNESKGEVVLGFFFATVRGKANLKSGDLDVQGEAIDLWFTGCFFVADPFNPPDYTLWFLKLHCVSGEPFVIINYIGIAHNNYLLGLGVFGGVKIYT